MRFEMEFGIKYRFVTTEMRNSGFGWKLRFAAFFSEKKTLSFVFFDEINKLRKVNKLGLAKNSQKIHEIL